MGDSTSKYETAERRWAGVGPYYAMFPVEFADHIVQQYTSPSQTILDPFAGRGTSIFSAAIRGRTGMGVELNPVGWVYSQAKLNAAPKDDVIQRLREIGTLSERCTSELRLPVFFSWCFTPTVRRFLTTARRHLNWRQCRTDQTLMALILVNMHGKRDASLSNQMRQTKAMSPQYAINWWRQRNLRPPKIDPIAFMEKRIEWRYAKGVPQKTDSFVYLGDSIVRLPHVLRRANQLSLSPAKLLLTSPPYCGVTNYHYDQWLRLWLLGGSPQPHSVPGNHRGRFYDQEKYRNLLIDVFSRATPLLDKKAVIYVRTDHREQTLRTTVEVLKAVFPSKRLFQRHRPVDGPTQTHLFRNKIEKSAEIDLVLLPAA